MFGANAGHPGYFLGAVGPEKTNTTNMASMLPGPPPRRPLLWGVL